MTDSTERIVRAQLKPGTISRLLQYSQPTLRVSVDELVNSLIDLLERKRVAGILQTNGEDDH